ncbi:MAG: mechanosensitive ion channel [Longimicrobiales bacterium]
MIQTADTAGAAATEVATDAAFDIHAALANAFGKVTGWLEGLVQSLPNLIAAIVVLLIFWGLARMARRVVERIAGRIAEQPEVNRLVAQASYLVVLAVGLVLALGVLNLDRTVTSLLAGAGILGLALGFAFQDIAENFIAGIILNIRHQFYEGDIIETSDFRGIVERVELRATKLMLPTGQRVLIPNADVYKKPIVNYSQTGTARVDIPVGVSYSDDLAKAKRVATEAVEGIEVRDTGREVELFYDEFGDNSINFKIRFWIDYARQADYHRARSEAIMRIKHAFDQNDITIPFPIRTLDFGAQPSGGQDLSTSLRESGFGTG